MFKSQGALYTGVCSEKVQLSKWNLICTYYHLDIIERCLLEILKADGDKLNQQFAFSNIVYIFSDIFMNKYRNKGLQICAPQSAWTKYT